MGNSNKRLTQSFAWKLDMGQQRNRNEDSVGAARITQVSADKDLSFGIYVVADGVGGSEDGDKASKIAVGTVMRAMLGQLGECQSDEDYRDKLKNATELAHRQIHTDKIEDHDTLTTLVVALVIDNKAVHIANVGDSRAYILRDNKLRKITTDHTIAQELVESGVLTEEQAERHSYRHILSQAVGSDGKINADVFTEALQIGDYLLLCSDGLYGAIDGDTIVRIITETEDTHEATEKLIKAANDAGGPDNISMVLAHIKERD